MDTMTMLKTDPFRPWAQMSDAQKWGRIKLERNNLLLSCDWTQMPDAALTAEEKTTWQDYRQALRDIPQDFTNPDDVIFPARPA